MKQKLLSLFVSLTLLCACLPGALAASTLTKVETASHKVGSYQEYITLKAVDGPAAGKTWTSPTVSMTESDTASQAVVANGMAYIVVQTTLYAIDGATMTTKWTAYGGTMNLQIGPNGWLYSLGNYTGLSIVTPEGETILEHEYYYPEDLFGNHGLEVHDTYLQIFYDSAMGSVSGLKGLKPNPEYKGEYILTCDLNGNPINEIPAPAPVPAPTPAPVSQTISITLDGKPVTADQPPIAENGRTLVPIRFVSEALGCQVEWNQDDNSVTVVNGATTLRLQLGSTTMMVGDKEVTLDTAPVAVNERTMVPVRAISEGLGLNVSWDQASYTVSITSK